MEVAHEALIRGWGRLRQWIEADRAGLRTHRRLTEAAHEWDHAGREPSLLFAGARLATAREWAESHRGELSPLEVDFLAAGLDGRAEEEGRRGRGRAPARRGGRGPPPSRRGASPRGRATGPGGPPVRRAAASAPAAHGRHRRGGPCLRRYGRRGLRGAKGRPK